MIKKVILTNWPENIVLDDYLSELRGKLSRSNLSAILKEREENIRNNIYIIYDNPSLDSDLDIIGQLKHLTMQHGALVLIVSHALHAERVIKAFRRGVTDYIFLPQEKEYFFGKISSILAEKKNYCGGNLWPIHDSGCSRTRSAVDFISKNLDKDLRLSHLAAACNMSESLFYKCFKQEMGMSVRTFIKKRRLEAAKSYLLGSNLSVKNIAFNVGYGNVSLFNRLFRESAGCTPSEYRDQRKKKYSSNARLPAEAEI